MGQDSSKQTPDREVCSKAASHTLYPGKEGGEEEHGEAGGEGQLTAPRRGIQKTLKSRQSSKSSLFLKASPSSPGYLQSFGASLNLGKLPETPCAEC